MKLRNILKLEKDNLEMDFLHLSNIFLAIQAYNSVRLRSRLTRSAIMPANEAPWQYLYEHADDSSFLSLTGFTRTAFRTLANILFDEILQ